MEGQQEMQRGVLDQHQLMITKIEEAMNESAIRINGFYGESFSLSGKCRRQLISNMFWEVDKKMWHNLSEQIGQFSFFDSKGTKLPFGKFQCKNLYQANKVLKAFNQKYSRNMGYE
eukprot:1548386-Karenia_brevis.AAC.1